MQRAFSSTAYLRDTKAAGFKQKINDTGPASAIILLISKLLTFIGRAPLY